MDKFQQIKRIKKADIQQAYYDETKYKDKQLIDNIASKDQLIKSKPGQQIIYQNKQHTQNRYYMNELNKDNTLIKNTNYKQQSHYKQRSKYQNDGVKGNKNMKNHTQKQKKIQQVKSGYKQLLKKYQELAGKPIQLNKKKTLRHAQNLQYQNKYTQNKVEKRQDQRIQLQSSLSHPQASRVNLFGSKSKNKIGAQEVSQNMQNYKTSRQIWKNNNTKIIFIAQKQYNLASFLQNKQSIDRQAYFIQRSKSTQQINQMSLPKINKLTKQPDENSKLVRRRSQSLAYKQKNKSDPRATALTTSKRQSRINIEYKKQMLKKVGLSLSNLKQKLSEASYNKKIGQEGMSSQGFKSNPNNWDKLKLSQISLSPSKNQYPIKNNKITEQNLHQQQGNDTIYKRPQIQSKQQISQYQKQFQNRTNTLTAQQMYQIKKLSQRKRKLQDIAQQYENENNDKQEMLRQHISQNKNIQMCLINKKQKINQLKFEINKIKQTLSQQQVSGMLANEYYQNQGESQKNLPISQLEKLKKEKQFKEQKYREEKQVAKKSIQQLQQKILEEQHKFMALKGEQLSIKQEEMIQRQLQLQNKNRLLLQQLQQKTKQIQEIINKQQQKSKGYELQLQQQKSRNYQMVKQLKKQQQLQEQLLQKISVIAKERKLKKERTQQIKKRQKLKLMEDIKKLEEAQSQILLQYQRDSQQALTIFQTIRIKNIQLENQIKKAKKQKRQNTDEPNDIQKRE